MAILNFWATNIFYFEMWRIIYNYHGKRYHESYKPVWIIII